MTIAATDLFKSFNKIVTKTGVGQCHPLVTSVTSAMSAEYFGDGHLKGLASYGAFYFNIPSADPAAIDGYDRFRVTWASANNNWLGYGYYGVCRPNLTVYSDSLGENHVYSVKLVPIEQYKAYKSMFWIG